MEKFIKLPNPAILPTGIGRGCAFSSDGQYLAVAHHVAPYITIYKRDGDTFIKLLDPIDVPIPAGTGYGCAFTSENGEYLAVTHHAAPHITIYKRDGDAFIKLLDPVDLPAGAGYSCAFTSDGQYLAVGSASSPYLIIYKRNGDTFEKLSNPAILPPQLVWGCAFTPDGQYLAAAHVASPYVTIYKRDGDTFEKLSNPVALPAGTGYGCAFSSDGQYLAVAHGGYPYVTIYKRDGDTFIKLLDPVDLPAGLGRGCAFTLDGQYLAIAHDTAPYITIYKRDGDTFIKLLDPVDVPTGTGYGCAFTSDGQYLALAHANSPFITIYKKEPQLISVDNYDIRLALEGFVDLNGHPSPPTQTSYTCDFSADGNYLIVVENLKSPYIRAYRREDEKFIELLVDPFDNDVVSGYSKKSLSLSPDGSYFVVLSYGPPYIAAYMRVGNYRFMKLPAIVTDWPGSLYSCAMSNQGEYFAVTYLSEDMNIFLDIYKRVGLQYIKIRSILLEWEGEYLPRVDTSISADGQYIAVIMEGAPYIYIFTREEEDEYVRIYPDEIPVFETGNEYSPYSYPVGGTIAPDASYLAVLYNEAPWICIYKRQGDIFKRLLEPIEPDDLPLNYIVSIDFSWDSKYMAFAQFWYPDYVRMYRRVGDSFIRMKDIPEEFYKVIGSPYCLSLTYDGNFLLVSGTDYSWDDPQSAVVLKRVIRDSMEEMRGQALLPPMNSIKHAVGRSVLQGQADMSIKRSIKTAVGKISFRGRAMMRLVGFALRKLEGIYQISSSEIFSRSQPVLSEDLANHIEVWINPVAPATIAEELYRSNEPEEIPPNESKTFVIEYSKKPATDVSASLENQGIYLTISDEKYYSGSAEITITNSSGQLQTCTIVITGKPLETQGRRKIVVRDENSILDHGLVKYEFDSPLVQNEATARNIGEKILKLFSIARANIEIEWRGDPALELADIVQIPEFEKLGIAKKENFYITRQEFRIGEGGMEVNMTGRKVPPNQ